MTCRSRRCSATRSPASGTGRAGPTSSQRRWSAAHSRASPSRSPMTGASLRSRRRRAGDVRAAAAGGGTADAGRTPAAAPRLSRGAARACQYPPAGRGHPERRAVARPRHRGPGDRDRDRRQSAPAIPCGVAGQGTVILSSTSRPRSPTGSTPSFMRTHRAPRSSACPCCAGGSWPRRASRPRTSSRRPTPPGRCRAIAASPMATRSRLARA